MRRAGPLGLAPGVALTGWLCDQALCSSPPRASLQGCVTGWGEGEWGRVTLLLASSSQLPTSSLAPWCSAQAASLRGLPQPPSATPHPQHVPRCFALSSEWGCPLGLTPTGNLRALSTVSWVEVEMSPPGYSGPGSSAGVPADREGHAEEDT